MISLCNSRPSTRFCCQAIKPFLPLIPCHRISIASTTATTDAAGRHTRRTKSRTRFVRERGTARSPLPAALVLACIFSSCMESIPFLFEYKLFGRRAERLHVLLAARFRVGPYHRLCSGEAVADPGAILENQLQAVCPDHTDDLSPAQLLWIGLHRSEE